MSIIKTKLFDLPPTYTFLDIESTGLKNDVDEIVNIAMLETTDTGLIVSAKDYWFVPTYRLITVSASAATGLTNAMVQQVANGQIFSHIKDELKADLLFAKNNTTLVIHNKSFDVPFIDAQFSRWRDPINLSLANNIIDTMDIARDFKSHGKESISLDSLKTKNNISDEQITAVLDLLTTIPLRRHTALFDCVLTKELFFKYKALR